VKRKNSLITLTPEGLTEAEASCFAENEVEFDEIKVEFDEIKKLMKLKS
jgi:hypothetical protein